MTPKTLATYRALRSKGWRVKDAGYAAHIRTRFAKADACGLVRLRPYWDEVSTLEDIGCSHEDDEACNEETRRIVERDGIQVLTSAVYVGDVPYEGACCDKDRQGEPCEHWDEVDAIHGFPGDTWKDSGYDDDLRASALKALTAHIRRTRHPLAYVV